MRLYRWRALVFKVGTAVAVAFNMHAWATSPSLAETAAADRAAAMSSARWLGADPADPHARVPPMKYRSPIASYHSRRPVEPGAWRGQNEGVGPKSAR